MYNKLMKALQEANKKAIANTHLKINVNVFKDGSILTECGSTGCNWENRNAVTGWFFDYKNSFEPWHWLGMTDSEFSDFVQDVTGLTPPEDEDGDPLTVVDTLEWLEKTAPEKHMELLKEFETLWLDSDDMAHEYELAIEHIREEAPGLF